MGTWDEALADLATTERRLATFVGKYEPFDDAELEDLAELGLP